MWRMVLQGRPCSCGELIEACPVWSLVHQDISAAVGSDDAAIEAARTGLGRGARGLYRQARTNQMKALASRVDGARIVDTSKSFVDAWSGPGPAVFLHCSRDPRAVAFSWSRPKPDTSIPGGMMRSKSAMKAALDWTKATLGAEAVISVRRGAALRLDYEAFCDAPDVALERVGAAADWTERDFGASLEHSLAGNPVRFDTNAVLRSDDRWKTEMSPRNRATVTALAGAPWAVVRRRARG